MESKSFGKALFFNGVIGDASPDLQSAATDPFQRCKEYGELVAQKAIDASASHTKVSAGIHYEQEGFAQEVTNQVFVAVRNFLDYDFDQDAGRLSVDTQFTYFRLGTEVQGIVFPGEALTRTGLDIKTPQKAPYHLFLGLTTDSLGYFVKSDEWHVDITDPAVCGTVIPCQRNDGYEETVSTGETAGDNAIGVLTGLIGKDTTF